MTTTNLSIANRSRISMIWLAVLAASAGRPLEDIRPIPSWPGVATPGKWLGNYIKLYYIMKLYKCQELDSCLILRTSLGLLPYEMPCEIMYLREAELSQRSCAHFVSLKSVWSYSRSCESTPLSMALLLVLVGLLLVVNVWTGVITLVGLLPHDVYA